MQLQLFWVEIWLHADAPGLNSTVIQHLHWFFPYWKTTWNLWSVKQQSVSWYIPHMFTSLPHSMHRGQMESSCRLKTHLHVLSEGTIVIPTGNVHLYLQFYFYLYLKPRLLVFNFSPMHIIFFDTRNISCCFASFMLSTIYQLIQML